MSREHLVLVCGESGTGKTASLRNIKNPEGVMYLNCESGKKPCFSAKFKQFVITDPLQVYQAFEKVETMDDIHTIVVDSLTYLMDMYESVYVIDAQNTMEMWMRYNQFFKNLMQQYVSKSTKDVIFTAHTLAQLNEEEMVMTRKVPVKGALKNVGIESFFSTVVATKTMAVTKLKDYASDLLNITDEERLIGMKYVYQTRLTKETVNERIRSSIGIWPQQETYIDNDAQVLLDKLHEYYK